MMNNPQIFISLSQILGRPVWDEAGQKIGSLADIVLRVTEEVYPRPEGIIVSRGVLRREYAFIKMEGLAAIDESFRLKLKGGHEPVHFCGKQPKMEFSICRDILDQQVVDVNHQKVVRVNDIHLLRVDNHLYPAHVDIGLRALVRRLGWTKFVDGLVKLFAPKSPYLTAEDFISWKSIQVLSSGRVRNMLRLDVARKKLSQIPPIELTEIMEDLDIFERISLFKSLEFQVQRKVFADLATQEKNDLIDQMEDEEAVRLLENIPADEATDVLLSLPKERTWRLMHAMESETARRLRKLLGFAKDSAGGLMTTEYLSLPQEATVADAMQLIKRNINYAGNIYHIYIVDPKYRLVGATSLRQLITKEDSVPILQTCFPTTVSVRTDDGMEEVALLLEKYKYSSIPVLDQAGILQGVITTDDVLEELISLAWSKYKEKLV